MIRKRKAPGPVHPRRITTIRRRYSTRLFEFQPLSRKAGGADSSNHSWREFFTPHPAAEVFHRRTTPEQLRELAEDIKTNGLKVPIQIRTVAGESQPYVIDGISRLDAMESLGLEIIDDKGTWKGALASAPGTRPMVEHRAGRTHEQIVGEVVTFNAKRRHQTKQELVEDIDDALRAIETTESAKIARSVESQQPVRVGGGKFAGSTKGRTGRVVEHAKAVGVSESTTKHTLAQRRAIDAIKRGGKPPPKRQKKELTSREEFAKRYFRWRNHWPYTKSREWNQLLYEKQLSRFTYKDGKEQTVLPVKITYPGNHSLTFEELVAGKQVGPQKPRQDYTTEAERKTKARWAEDAKAGRRPPTIEEQLKQK